LHQTKPLSVKLLTVKATPIICEYFQGDHEESPSIFMCQHGCGDISSKELGDQPTSLRMQMEMQQQLKIL
jgi:hypothetical protein